MERSALSLRAPRRPRSSSCAGRRARRRRLAEEAGHEGAAPTHFPILLPEPQEWSFAGIFGKYDTAQLQRGFQVYKEVCANCHSMKLRRLPPSRRGGRPAFHRGRGQGAGGDLSGHRRAERRRRHVRAAGAALRPSAEPVPQRAGRRGRQWRRGAARPVADGQGPRQPSRPVLHRPRLLHPVSGRRAGLHPRPAHRLQRSAGRPRRPRGHATTIRISRPRSR